MPSLKASYPLYLANEALTPNQDLEVIDKYSGKVATRVAMADAATIDRAIDQVHARRIQAMFQQLVQMRRAFHAVAVRAIAFGIFDEIGVAIGQPPILEAHIGLFPADHAIAVVVEDQHGQVETQPHCGFHLLRIHQIGRAHV